MYVMIICGDGLGRKTLFDGEYVMSFDPNGQQGRGTIKCTRQIKNALQFDSAQKALELWRTQSTAFPLRPDGQPNRPMTAYTVEISKVE